MPRTSTTLTSCAIFAVVAAAWAVAPVANPKKNDDAKEALYGKWENDLPKFAKVADKLSALSPLEFRTVSL